MRKLIILLIMLALIPLASAIEEQFIFETNTTPTLTFTCKDNFLGRPCGSDYACNISINYPNGNNLFNNTNTSRIAQGVYELPLSGLSQNGLYIYNGYCYNESDSANSDDLGFRVTQSGKTFTEAEGITSLGILISIFGLAFLFMILGFKFTKNEKTFALALFFIVISMILVVYTLQLGYTYSFDILEHGEISSMQSTIYSTVLFLVVGVGIVSFILMAFGFFRLLMNKRMRENFGEGFDPISQTYQN